MPAIKVKQDLMTRAEFEHWLASSQPGLYDEGRDRLVACHCGDVNCHGWRIVRKDPR